MTHWQTFMGDLFQRRKQLDEEIKQIKNQTLEALSKHIKYKLKIENGAAIVLEPLILYNEKFLNDNDEWEDQKLHMSISLTEGYYSQGPTIIVGHCCIDVTSPDVTDEQIAEYINKMIEITAAHETSIEVRLPIQLHQELWRGGP